MSVLIKRIIDFLGNDVLMIKGNYDNVLIKHLKDATEIDECSLDWVNPAKKNKQKIAEESKAQAILVDELILYSGAIKKQNKVLIYVKNPKISLAKVGNEFFVGKLSPKIHATAVIDPDAIIGKNVFVGAGCVIGKCTIGNGVVIYPNVTIYDKSTIGDNSIIHSGSVICTDGLGCQRLEDGTLLEFPQLGGVKIGKNVYIGSNTHIASGALSDTIIGDGSKINGLCFIGSNCKIGKNVWITGSTMLAGSVKVGNNVTIYSKAVIREHKIIGHKATIGMGAVVTKDVPPNETWIGNPAKRIEK